MTLPPEQSYPARPAELKALEKQAERGFEMTPVERMNLMEKMRQAYYGYDPENAPPMKKILTYFDIEKDRPIFTVDENGVCTYH
jgi:hypothetical protein